MTQDKPTFDPPPNEPSSSAASRRRPGALRSFLQLCRVPNLFTAVADVAAGYLLALATLEPGASPLSFSDLSISACAAPLLLLAASALLYTAGIVFNDVCDLEVDRLERPYRPLPSGRIRVATARWLAAELALVGLAAAWWAGGLSSLRTGLVATLLAAAIVLYDLWLKKTPLGPLGMGVCRGLNVLLGLSVIPLEGHWRWHQLAVAGGMFVYITGLTLFAKREATTSQRSLLLVGSLLMAAGMALVAYYPRIFVLESAGDPSLVGGQLIRMWAAKPAWLLLWLATGGLILRRFLSAVADPSPERVQAAVKHGILSIIVLDAAVVYACQGLTATLAVLVLIVPAMFLGRFIYST